MHILIHLAVLALTIVVLSRVLPGFHVRSLMTAVVVAIVFSVLNFALGWLVRVMLFLPAILTLGLLFLVLPLIVNVIMLWLTDLIIGSFEIDDTRTLWLGAAAITAVNFVLHLVVRAHYIPPAWHSGGVWHV